MPDIKLHEGVWARQVLKGKRTVRVTFIPDNATEPVLSTKFNIETDNKIGWESLLGGALSGDINLGIIMVRFNPDNKSGTAYFLSNLSSQPEIVHAFQQSEPDPNGPVGATGDFFSCLNGKKSILGVKFNLPLALSECLSQLFI